MGRIGLMSLDAGMLVSVACLSLGMNGYGLGEVSTLENEEERKQSLKGGLIELEDGLDTENEKKESLMITKISIVVDEENGNFWC